MKKHRILRNLLIDAACAGLALLIFALFHHVLPRPQQGMGIVISNPYQSEPGSSGGSIALPDGAVVIAHTGDEEVPLVLDMSGRAGARSSLCGGIVRECRITDETRTNEIVPLPTTLPPHSILVVIADSN